MCTSKKYLNVLLICFMKNTFLIMWSLCELTVLILFWITGWYLLMCKKKIVLYFYCLFVCRNIILGIKDLCLDIYIWYVVTMLPEFVHHRSKDVFILYCTSWHNSKVTISFLWMCNCVYVCVNYSDGKTKIINGM